MPAAELVERRALAKRNTGDAPGVRTQSLAETERRLAWVREAAQQDRRLRLTNLLIHVTAPLLSKAYWALRRDAKPGVDGEDWQSFGKDLRRRITSLHARVQSGRYRAQPVRRRWIEKADGRQRPLGVACVEDKVVQQAVVWVLEAIYEVDFLGFSYGFRPGRSQHGALDAVYMAITTRPVNWVLDADIEACFDRIEHEKLLKLLAMRIADPRLLRLIEQTLAAGVVEEGQWQPSPRGVPQGAVISPLLANVYLHYAVDRWVHAWRQRRARGTVLMVRYADDFVVGFQDRGEGERFQQELALRLARFGLTLHPSKTRLIEFGRFASSNRRRRGEGRPETFDFLGFTHGCGVQRRNGGFALRRQSVTKRVRAFLQKLKQELRARYAEPVAVQGTWLRQKITGYFQYHAVPGNQEALNTVRREAYRLWLRTLRRRSQRHHMPWARFQGLVRRWIPNVRVIHPYPDQRFAF
jgi:RNA-directed DNA polymerase